MWWVERQRPAGLSSGRPAQAVVFVQLYSVSQQSNPEDEMAHRPNGQC